MKKILFIDRDGTLIEEPADEQIDAFEKLKFVPGMIRNLAFIREKLDFEFVMVSNQDGLGTDAFPENTFWPVQNFILQTLEGEGITFDDILIDPHFPEDNAPTRKPNTGLVEKYMNDSAYDIANSYVIGDRETDRTFARNIGCKSLILSDEGMSWSKIAELLFAGERIAEVSRKTKETDIHIKVNLDKLSKQQKVSYERLAEDLTIDLADIHINVPETYEHPFPCSMPVEEWVGKTHKGIPFAGWQRCCYEAIPFDTPNEYRIARVIDMSEEVRSWFRNLPGIITLLTPAGNYSPDFAIFLNLDDKNVLLELKDDDRFGGEDQDATIKANAAREWCKAQTIASGKPWEYWLLLDSDAEFCQTFDDIRDSVDV